MCIVAVALSTCIAFYSLRSKPIPEFAVADNPERYASSPWPVAVDTGGTWPASPETPPDTPATVGPTRETNSLDAFQAMLAAGEYERAVDAYDHTYTGASAEVSSRYRRLLLDHASHLIQDDVPERAIEMLNQYLSIFYTDVDALVFLGRAYRDVGLRLDAIRSLQRAYRHEHRTAVSTLILSQENTLIGEYVQELHENNDQQKLVELYQWLTQSQPGVSGYYIGLADAYAAQSRAAEAVQVLRYVQYDLDVGPQARAMLRELTEPEKKVER